MSTCGCRAGGLGRGLSAQAIMYGGTFHPHDPSDLCRCLAVSADPPMHMLGRSPEWTILVHHWAELAALLAEEHDTGAAPRTYARMKELFEIARQQPQEDPVSQPALFGDDPEPDPRAYAKRDDPATSWEAARSITPDQLKERHKAVLLVMQRCGPCHNDRLVEAYLSREMTLGLPHQTAQSIRSRRSELTDWGFIVDTGDRVTLPSGRGATVWKINEDRT